MWHCVEFQDYQRVINERQAQVDGAMRDVDILIADSTYTADEYHQSKVGWGHGTFDFSIQHAKLANAKKLFFTHHKPARSDQQLDTIYQALREQHPDLRRECEVGEFHLF